MATRSRRPARTTSSGRRRVVTEPVAIRALAHPKRLAILDHLSAHHELTVQELSKLMGDSTASISYHTRQLAAHGFIEPGRERADKRVRPWRSVEDAFDVLAREADPRARHPAASALIDAQREHLDEALRAYTNVASSYDDDVRTATTFSISTTRLSPMQMRQLRSELLAVLEPYRSNAERPAEPGATVPVTIGLQIFARPPVATPPRRSRKRSVDD